MRNIARVARGHAEWAGTGHAVCLRGKASVFPMPISSHSQGARPLLLQHWGITMKCEEGPHLWAGLPGVQALSHRLCALEGAERTPWFQDGMALVELWGVGRERCWAVLALHGLLA